MSQNDCSRKDANAKYSKIFLQIWNNSEHLSLQIPIQIANKISTPYVESIVHQTTVIFTYQRGVLIPKKFVEIITTIKMKAQCHKLRQRVLYNMDVETEVQGIPSSISEVASLKSRTLKALMSIVYRITLQPRHSLINHIICQPRSLPCARLGRSSVPTIPHAAAGERLQLLLRLCPETGRSSSTVPVDVTFK